MYFWKKIKIIEIFRKRKIGITTILSVLYSQLRARIRTKDRFIPFIVFDYDKLINTNKINSLLDLINTSIVNLCVHYDDYNDFCTLVYDEIRELIFDIDKIVVKIIELFIERIKNLKMSYVPCIIIDIFDPIYTELYNKLIKLQNKNNFRIIIVYQLENKLTNRILLDYLEEKKKWKFCL